MVFKITIEFLHDRDEVLLDCLGVGSVGVGYLQIVRKYL